MQTKRDRWRVWAGRALLTVVLVASFTFSYVRLSEWRARREGNVWISMPGPERGQASEPVLQNPFASADGTHLIAFVITASGCGWSRQPVVMNAVGSIRATLQGTHGDSYAQVRVVGVGLDQDLEEGLRFMSELGKGSAAGAFDQVIVGGSWLNEQLVRLVWREGIAKASTPQVVVVERPINTRAYMSESKILVEGDSVVASVIGGEKLVQWIRDGAPIEARRVARAGTR